MVIWPDIRQRSLSHNSVVNETTLLHGDMTGYKTTSLSHRVVVNLTTLLHGEMTGYKTTVSQPQSCSNLTTLLHGDMTGYKTTVSQPQSCSLNLTTLLHGDWPDIRQRSYHHVGGWSDWLQLCERLLSYIRSYHHVGGWSDWLQLCGWETVVLYPVISPCRRVVRLTTTLRLRDCCLISGHITM